MIVSQYFVFIHLSKTGGEFVRAVCREHAPSDWHLRIIDGHPSIYDIPQAYQTLPKLGFIRNPYSWYVSAYAYLKKRGDNPIFKQITNNGTRDFKSTLLTVLDLDLDFVESNGLGGYSWHIKHMFGDNLQDLRIGKFEELRHELLRLLNSTVILPKPFIKAVLTYPVVNASSHDHYRTYYDQELRQIVAERDQWIFEQFNYEF